MATSTLIKPNVLKVDNQNVYNAEEIYNYDRRFFIGCPRVRVIVEKKRLTEEDYLFGYYNKKREEWVKSTPNYPRAKLFLTEEYVIQNVPKMAISPEEQQQRQELYKYEEAPPILELEQHEQFTDKNGKIINIEVRGERNHKNCFFKVKDVSAGFEMPNLFKTLNHKNGDYEYNIHYKTFINGGNYDATLGRTIYSFLTYNGMLKVLFSSRTGNAESFQSWATEKLFTIQMGTKNEKQKLASSLIGASQQAIKEVFSASCTNTPCIYLILIGKAKQLLEGSYTNKDLFCKFGRSDNISRRMREHYTAYFKEFETEIRVLCFAIIDPKNLTVAEDSLRQYLKPRAVEYEESRETVIINQDDLESIKEHFSMIQRCYIGRYEELNNKANLYQHKIELYEERMKTLEEKYQTQKEILIQRHQSDLELKDKEIELKDKEMEIKEKEMELKNKDLEILQLKLSFCNSNNNQPCN